VPRRVRFKDEWLAAAAVVAAATLRMKPQTMNRAHVRRRHAAAFLYLISAIYQKRD
jgi:hypothetical protein